MTLQEGYFLCHNPLDDPAEIQTQQQLSQIIFANDEDGNPVNGCSLSIVERIDSETLKLFIRTTPEVWAMRDQFTHEVNGEQVPYLTLISQKLACSECGKEWWGLPTESGLCAECEAAQAVDLLGEPTGDA